MILKIDHIAFSTPHLDEDIKTFETLGYHVKFIEKNLRDLENKQSFMSHFSGQVDMALMTRPGSIGIELLNHGHVVEERSFILPVLEGVFFDVKRTGDSFSVDGCFLSRAWSDLLNAEIFIQEGVMPAEFRCNKVVVDADNTERGAEFWCSLGFKPVAAGEGVTHLEFKSPFAEETCQLYIRKGEPRPNQSLLDSHGFNCIAFISTDTEKEKRRFQKLGMKPTESVLFQVNGKELNIFWLCGPCGEIVEVIGLAE